MVYLCYVFILKYVSVLKTMLYHFIAHQMRKVCTHGRNLGSFDEPSSNHVGLEGICMK